MNNDSLKGLLLYYGTMLICGVIIGFAIHLDNKLDEYISHTNIVEVKIDDLLTNTDELKVLAKEVRDNCIAKEEIE